MNSINNIWVCSYRKKLLEEDEPDVVYVFESRRQAEKYRRKAKSWHRGGRVGVPRLFYIAGTAPLYTSPRLHRDIPKSYPAVLWLDWHSSKPVGVDDANSGARVRVSYSSPPLDDSDEAATWVRYERCTVSYFPV